MTEEQARKTYDRALKVEQEFGEYFTGEETLELLSNFRFSFRAACKCLAGMHRKVIELAMNCVDSVDVYPSQLVSL